LERWHLHNEVFGDQAVFLGALQSDAGLRLLICQPAIAGTPATDEEIRRFFTDSGWKPFVIDGNIAPIDLRVQPLSDSLLDTVTKLCSH
jgi:hypothetical protein